RRPRARRRGRRRRGRGWSGRRSYDPPDEYLLGHFVSSESGCATNTPRSSRPVTITRRDVLKASGTEPRYDTGTVCADDSSRSTNRIGSEVRDARTTVPVSVTCFWAAPSVSLRSCATLTSSVPELKSAWYARKTARSDPTTSATTRRGRGDMRIRLPPAPCRPGWLAGYAARSGTR